MSNLTDHLAEQDAITAACEAGRCGHPDCPPEDALFIKVCARCGSGKITVKATAEWDLEYQMWNVHEITDEGYCYDCGQEAEIEDRPIALSAEVEG